MSEDLINSKELAKKLGLSYSHTKQLLKQGKISGALKVGRNWLIDIGTEPIKAKRLRTAKTVAKRLGFSHSHIRRLIRDGKIEGTKIGGEWVITNLKQIPYQRQRKAKVQVEKRLLPVLKHKIRQQP